jgi:caa(3)-type oxidase subunit IV
VDFGGFFSWLFHIHVAPQTSSKLNITVAIIVAAFKVSLVALIFMHLAAEKRLIYRVLIFTGFFVLGLFWLTFLAWYNPIVR